MIWSNDIVGRFAERVRLQEAVVSSREEAMSSMKNG
jgi:hypothetical protein